MLSLVSIGSILFGHWFADFILQDEKWAINKSTSIKALLSHTVTYSAFWFLPIWFISGNPIKALSFVGITFVFHTITDYLSSKVVKMKFDKKQFGSSIPNFGGFSVIGLDQFLHYMQLVITWIILLEK